MRISSDTDDVELVERHSNVEPVEQAVERQHRRSTTLLDQPSDRPVVVAVDYCRCVTLDQRNTSRELLSSLSSAFPPMERECNSDHLPGKSFDHPLCNTIAEEHPVDWHIEAEREKITFFDGMIDERLDSLPEILDSAVAVGQARWLPAAAVVVIGLEPLLHSMH
jgi:hypothetical protein